MGCRGPAKRSVVRIRAMAVAVTGSAPGANRVKLRAEAGAVGDEDAAGGVCCQESRPHAAEAGQACAFERPVDGEQGVFRCWRQQAGLAPATDRCRGGRSGCRRGLVSDQDAVSREGGAQPVQQAQTFGERRALRRRTVGVGGQAEAADAAGEPEARDAEGLRGGAGGGQGQVDDEPDAALAGLAFEMVEVVDARFGAVGGVREWRGRRVRGKFEGREDESVDAERLQVVEPRSDGGESAGVVSGGVRETPRIELVEDGSLPPWINGNAIAGPVFVRERLGGGRVHQQEKQDRADQPAEPQRSMRECQGCPSRCFDAVPAGDPLGRGSGEGAGSLALEQYG